MSRSITLLALLAGLAPFAAAQASPVNSDTDTAACKQETRRNGAGEVTGDAVCAIKRIFQRRIRRRPDEDPVEMTVGSPPMQSEDSDTPGAGNWEINIAMGAEFAGGDREIELPILDVNYGLGDRVQLTYSVPYVSLREDGASAHGLGDSEFGLKYRFYDNEDRGISMALYPQLRVRTPGANEDVSEGATAWALPLILVSEFEHFSITANAGLEFSDGERGTFGSFGAGRRLTDRLAVMAELAGNSLNSSEARHVLLNLGFRQKFEHSQSLSASIGRDLDAGSAERKQSCLMVNYQKLLGE